MSQQAEETVGLSKEDFSAWIVDWDGPDDPRNPLNWSFKRRLLLTIAVGFMPMAATYNSSTYSAVTPDVRRIFGVNDLTATLGITLYLIGFCGAVLFAPMSERYGRRVSLLFGGIVFACFSWATATAKDVQTLMICRFFAGVFSSSPVGVMPGILSDIYPVTMRGQMMVLYSCLIVMGPTLGPLVGEAILLSPDEDAWRYVLYTGALMASVSFVPALIWLPETNTNLILKSIAEKKRLATGDFRYHAPIEEQPTKFSHVGRMVFLRPMQMLFTEPILLLFTLYCSFSYSIVYMFLEAIPYEFHTVRGWSSFISSLAFIALLIGLLIGGLANFLFSERYRRLAIKLKKKPPPEQRLPQMMVGGVLLVPGFFWFGWSTNVHWINPCLALVFVGSAFLMLLQATLLYVMDCYAGPGMRNYAASAISATTFLRSICAGCLPLATSVMYENLGVSWASSVLAFISLAFVPLPFIFYFFGDRIRAISPMAAS